MQNQAGQPLRLTRAQVREIDRRAIEQYHVPGIVLMENAARAVTDAALDMLRGVKVPSVQIVCGGGNNGGDGLAVARHLHNRGVVVDIAVAVNPKTYTGDAAVNFEIVRAMGIPSSSVEDGDIPLASSRVDLIVDALFGTGLQSPPRATWQIEMMASSGAPVLAVDLPSGLDCDTGEPLGPACVRATRTVTFVAEKAGFANPAAKPYVGDVIVGDIGCPRELIEQVARGK
jgi:NAD(P)H-hydrate epimerase